MKSDFGTANRQSSKQKSICQLATTPRRSWLSNVEQKWNKSVPGTKEGVGGTLDSFWTFGAGGKKLLWNFVLALPRSSSRTISKIYAAIFDGHVREMEIAKLDPREKWRRERFLHERREASRENQSKFASCNRQVISTQISVITMPAHILKRNWPWVKISYVYITRGSTTAI